eukprot:Opistho-2@56348
MGTVLCTQKGPLTPPKNSPTPSDRAFLRTFRDDTAPDGAPSPVDLARTGSRTSTNAGVRLQPVGDNNAPSFVSSSDIKIETLENERDDEGYASSVASDIFLPPIESGIRRMPMTTEEADFLACESNLRRKSWPPRRKLCAIHRHSVGG